MLTPQAALIYTMVIVAEADSDISSSEASLISDLVGHLPVFDHLDEQEMTRLAVECSDMIATEQGLDRAFAGIRDALTPTLREAAYALACDVMASDRYLNRNEIRILERVRHELQVQPNVADLLEGATRIRYQAA